MQNKKRKMITMQMIIFELRNVTGNPYVHIFGVGLPVVLAELITMVAVSEVNDPSLAGMIATSVYLGMGTLIPMATILMGYAVCYAQELDKGIPERPQIFTSPLSMTACCAAGRFQRQYLLRFLLGFSLLLDTECQILNSRQHPA